MIAATPVRDLRDDARSVVLDLPSLPEVRDAAIATWRGRMINEYSSAVVFEGLAVQIEAVDLGANAARECRGFADEERRHGVLCGAVVEALGGEAIFAAPNQASFPSHDDVSPLEALLRNVISICCLSETVAVALIGAERLEMPEGALRELLTGIYADEVGHARFGWRLLDMLAPQIDDAMRERLGAYLTVAFEALETHELAHLNPAANPPPAGAALGLCNGSDARELFYAAVHDVIVPGLIERGLPAAEAWAQRAA